MAVTSAVWDVTTKLGQCFFLLRSFTDRRFIAFKDEVSNLSMACALSVFRLFEIPRTIAHQAPLSTGFSRQEYWSGLPFPSPGESSQAEDRTSVSSISCTGRQILYHWVTREALSKQMAFFFFFFFENFHVKEAFLWLLFGIFKFSALLFLSFEAILRKSKGHLNTSAAILRQWLQYPDGTKWLRGRTWWTRGWTQVPVLGGMQGDVERLHHSAQNGGQSKLISYFFLECSTYYFLIAVDHGNWNHRRWKDCALLCYIFNRFLSSDKC